jgi:hypothetical protein
LGGRFNAISLSDLLPRRELERTRFHELVLAPLGVRDNSRSAAKRRARVGP